MQQRAHGLNQVFQSSYPCLSRHEILMSRLGTEMEISILGQYLAPPYRLTFLMYFCYLTAFRPTRVDPYMDSPSQTHPNSRGRPITIEDEPERPMANQWPHSPYSHSSHRPYAPDREQSHGIPMQSHNLQMRGDYGRSMTESTVHSGLSSLQSHS
jgi:hypothetical protein